MLVKRTDQSGVRVLLLEPNAALRAAIQTILSAEGYQIQVCSSLEQLVVRAHASPTAIALAAWQTMDGLLAEEHRHDLSLLTRHVRLVLMVPRRWARLLESTDLRDSIAGMVAKPFAAEELLDALEAALSVPVEAAR
jgi:DNA-binding response OmpR family regulator